MRRLALIVAMIWTPATAADHSPWADWQDWAQPPLAVVLDEAQAALGQKCCKHCTKCQRRDKNGPGTGLKWGQLV